MAVPHGAVVANWVDAAARAAQLQAAAEQERQREAIRRQEFSFRAVLLRPDAVAWGLPRQGTNARMR